MTGAEFGGVDIDLLADYIGGALAGTPDESAVAARIADDPAWRAAYESLGGAMALVGAELGRLESEPMPAELAGRLEAMFREPVTLGSSDDAIADATPVDAALAAPRVPHLVAVRGGGASGSRSRRVPDRAAPQTGRRLRWAAPIAVAAGLVAFVGFGADLLAGRERSTDSASSSAAGKAQPDAGSAKSAASPPADGQIFASGTNYTISSLGGEPIRPLKAPELVSPAAPRSTAGKAADQDPELRRFAAHSALIDCLNAIEQENAAGTISVQTVDYARFDGTPAVIVRFTAANGSWAWASGPACGTTGGDAATLGQVPVR